MPLQYISEIFHPSYSRYNTHMATLKLDPALQHSCIGQKTISYLGPKTVVARYYAPEGGHLRLSFYLENEKKIPGTEVLKMTVVGFEPSIFSNFFLTSATMGETLTPNPNDCNSTLTSVI